MLWFWGLAIRCWPRFADDIKPGIRVFIGANMLEGTAISLIIRQNREDDLPAGVKRAIRQRWGRRSSFIFRLQKSQKSTNNALCMFMYAIVDVRSRC